MNTLLAIIVLMDNSYVSTLKVRTMYAYLGEKGKFCGKSLFGSRRKCKENEYCATSLGGLWAGEFTCLEIKGADKFQNGLCRVKQCSCGLSFKSFGTCTKGEICHNNNSLGLLGEAVAVIPGGTIVYAMNCSNPHKYENVSVFNMTDEIDENGKYDKDNFAAEIKVATDKDLKNKNLTLDEYWNFKNFGDFAGKTHIREQLGGDKMVRIKARYAYLGEAGKFCGYYLNVNIFSGMKRRRCATDEYCGTGFGGAFFENYTCIKLQNAKHMPDIEEQGVCNKESCRCGFSLGTWGHCSRGEYCHANNPAFILGDLLQ